ncbi:MAG: shikimate dehydrogenase family protein, partial [Alphaproteobacteria bacterium]
MNATAAPAITGNTRIYCIIGHPVAPVRSPAFYNALFRASAMDAVFVAIDIAAKDAARGFEGLRAMANVAGIVVTMPLKQLVLPLVDEVLPRARQVGAVNTIRREPDGRLVGDMFDGRGGVLGLRWEGHEPRGRRVLLAGAGGAGSALAFALAEAGASALSSMSRAPVGARSAVLVDRVEEVGEQPRVRLVAEGHRGRAPAAA